MEIDGKRNATTQLLLLSLCITPEFVEMKLLIRKKKARSKESRQDMKKKEKK